jgi:hypothetical protein
MLAHMKPVRLCHGCEQRLMDLSDAVRRHAADVSRALDTARRANPTEEQLDDFRTALFASFNRTEAAWNVYCDHLREHGVLPQHPATQL